MITTPERARRYLLFIAGMGGLLYGIDVGIIAGALPYLESTATLAWKLSTQQLSFIVAAVLLGSVLSSLFAGLLADLVGRRWCMVLAGALFTISIPMIALSDGYIPLLLGRLLQGISGGLIGVVVPLYLAESLPADGRGRGAALFQLMLTIGLVGAAVIGLSQARNVDAVTQAAAALDPAQRSAMVFAAQDHAWRTIFWLCLAPGLVFTVGSLALKESPRWLAQRTGTKMKAAEAPVPVRDALASRRYVLPFLLACLVLALTQATGINSVLAYVVTILNQAGLPGATANAADVALKVLNAVMTVVAVALVDRKGRKFLLMLGSSAIVVALVAAGLLFRGAESTQADVRAQIQAQVRDDGLALRLDQKLLSRLGADGSTPQQLTVAYAYGPFTNVKSLRSDDPLLPTVTLRREDAIAQDSVIGATLRRWRLNPFSDPAAGRTAPLVIERAWLGAVPAEAHGWQVALAICLFVAGFAVGPGVCVWLALSELMPTRIRSNGMSIALLINQFVSTLIAAMFLPTVGFYGYSTVFFVGAGFSLLYFLTAAFLLPETKGKTLEEIELHFTGAGKPQAG
ncbi:sugar porter family MFS transporter [Massilia sp. G4R7]|uniref:Sugar porter family MFS transporter n=2 Tax=Massilia TaxID=149698 RepID=A0ABS8Q1Y8_9BURK|nr:MFS transporter [Massilia phyllostachyos]MCD2515753.1 sugar porter family MFS transporter [Massilia phyllostachyos]